jgi:hypothetical protein
VRNNFFLVQYTHLLQAHMCGNRSTKQYKFYNKSRSLIILERKNVFMYSGIHVTYLRFLKRKVLYSL